MLLVKQGQTTRDPLHRSAKWRSWWNSTRAVRNTKALSIKAGQLLSRARGRMQEGERGSRGRGCGRERGRRNNHDALGKLMSTDSGQLRRG